MWSGTRGGPSSTPTRIKLRSTSESASSPLGAALRHLLRPHATSAYPQPGRGSGPAASGALRFFRANQAAAKRTSRRPEEDREQLPHGQADWAQAPTRGPAFVKQANAPAARAWLQCDPSKLPAASGRNLTRARLPYARSPRRIGLGSWHRAGPKSVGRQPLGARACRASVRKLAAANPTMVPMPPEPVPESEHRAAFDRLMESLKKKVATVSVGRPVLDDLERPDVQPWMPSYRRALVARYRSFLHLEPSRWPRIYNDWGTEIHPEILQWCRDRNGAFGIGLSCATRARPAPTASPCSGSGSPSPRTVSCSR